MQNADDPTRKMLWELGVSDAVALALRFTQLRARFRTELAQASQEGGWEKVRDLWTGFGDSVSASTGLNWIKNAPEHLYTLAFRDRETLIEFINIRLTVAQTLQQLGYANAEAIKPLFTKLRQAFEREIAACTDDIDLGVSKVDWLGRRSGVLMYITENWMKTAAPELKRVVGQELNAFRAYVESKIDERRASIESGVEVASLAKDRIDLSLPGVVRPVGSRHLIRQVFQEIEDIFGSIGFSVFACLEIATPYYNFMALNIPEFHQD